MISTKIAAKLNTKKTTSGQPASFSKVLRTLCLLPALLAPPLLYAVEPATAIDPASIKVAKDTPWYQVSLVVFTQRKGTMGDEAWPNPDRLDLSLPTRFITLGPAATDPKSHWTPFQSAQPLDDEYNQSLRSIKLSSHYHVLTEMTWNQPALDKDQAIPVLIQAGKAYGEHHELEGTITLVVARYLHLKADLRLAEYVESIEPVLPPQPAAESTDATGQSTGIAPLALPPGAATQQSAVATDNSIYAAETRTLYVPEHPALLQESRRMRSGELHFLDNPMFGVVVKVIRLEAEAKDNALPDSPVSQR